jgi:excisionase family DNA binding protein
MAVRDRTVLPPEDDAAFRSLVAQLDDLRASDLVLADGTRLPLPEPIAEVLSEVASALAQGQAVTVAPQHTTLTTQQAADLLGVSRPTLVKLLEAGELPYTQPGRHRRVRLTDLLAYRERIRTERKEGLDELARISDDAGLYEDEVTRTRVRR